LAKSAIIAKLPTISLRRTSGLKSKNSNARGGFVPGAQWRAFVDDVEIKDFQRDDNAVTVPDRDLHDASVGRIDVMESLWEIAGQKPG
jgi:hypothetical protein